MFVVDFVVVGLCDFGDIVDFINLLSVWGFVCLDM